MLNPPFRQLSVGKRRQGIVVNLDHFRCMCSEGRAFCSGCAEQGDQHMGVGRELTCIRPRDPPVVQIRFDGCVHTNHLGLLNCLYHHSGGSCKTSGFVIPIRQKGLRVQTEVF